MLRHRLPALQTYVAGVVVAALVVVTTALATTSWDDVLGRDPTLFLILVTLLVVGELRPVKFLRRQNGGEVTATWTFAVALLLTAPFASAALVAGGASVVADTISRKPAVKVAFNAAQIVLSLGVGAAILVVTGQRGALADPQSLGLLWLPVSTAALAAIYLTNSLLLCVVLALAQRLPARSLLRSSVLMNLSTDGMLLALAPVLVVVSQQSLVLLPLLLVTAYAVYDSACLALERQHAATHDQLTGIPNRRLFLEQARSSTASATRSGRRLAVVLFDLDGFKTVNDTLGHHVGDQVLVEVARRLQAVSRTADVVARLGGDEFAVLLSDVEDAPAALEAGERLMGAVVQPVTVAGFPLRVGGSAGVALYPDAGGDVEELLQRADVAMYAAKTSGGGVRLATVDAGNRPGRFALLGDLERALGAGELVLHYQPVVDLASGDCVGLEALVRWEHPVRGTVGPSDFMPLVEQSELDGPVTALLLADAVGQCASWRARGLDVYVAVNVSTGSLQDRTLPARVAALLAEHELDPSALELEITEHVMLANGGAADRVLAELRRMGVAIAVDDFGTGYSSLAHLRRVQANTLKIDRSFITGMATSHREAAIVRAVMELAATLGLTTVAEGVEDGTVLDLLRDLGCDRAQGYLLARPAPADVIGPWLLQRDAARRALVAAGRLL